jgi:ubiquinol-cytochrome c reductase cytochrome c1 subunit
MKELKILVTILALIGVTYWGIEPYAHHVMHPDPDPADFTFSDLKNVDTSMQGDVAAGKASFEMNCIACHSLTADGFEAPMSAADSAAAYGVVPPDLSTSGRIYETNYLANFIYDPVTATKLAHKYNAESGKSFPMPSYNWMGGQEIMNIVTYLKSIAPKRVDHDGLVALSEKEGRSVSELSKEQNKETFKDACSRCHSMDYAGIEAQTSSDTIKNYMGSNPPDLSQYIKSRGETFLTSFINNPQHLLHGTSMPRVGLTQQAQEDVIEYMEQVGDAKKAERESLGKNVLIYMVIFTVLAIMWKRKIWSEVH